MSDQPSPALASKFTNSQLFFYVISQGVWLTVQAMLTLAGAIALARLDAMHNYRMGPVYLTAAWSCWWIIVLAGWTFLGLAVWRTWTGMVVLDRPLHAWLFAVVGGLTFAALTAFLIAMARTFAGVIWL